MQKITIHPVNDDDKCFQYAVTATLSHEEVERNHILKKKNVET